MTSLSAASLNGLLTVPGFSPRPPQAPPLALAASEPPFGRLLVFEDETVIALDLQRILRDAGYRIVGPASSLAEVRALVSRGRLDGAVIDLDVQLQAGIEVADLLADAGIPFVLLATGREAVPGRHAARPFVEKPYSSGRLLEALDQVSGGRRPAAVPSALAGKVSFPRIFPQL